MRILPIVGRELRVASRKRGTYWTRVIAAALALLLMGSFLGAWSATRQITGANSGQILFSILKWLCFVFACGGGMFLTSDCLSEEKRDGTLGLLFLTDLRGYDVVLGKLIATSFRAFYGLLAIFPELGLTLMLGGVSGTEFWRTILAICNALLFSLAAGVFVSALSRDTLKAMSATLLLCALALGGPALLDLWRADWDDSNFEILWSLSSPVCAFVCSSHPRDPHFWLAVAVPHAASWFLLGLACLAVPRTWQEKANVGSAGIALGVRVSRSWKSNRPRVATKSRGAKWLEINPLVWLAGRDVWVMRCASTLALAAAGLSAFLYLKLDPTPFLGVMSAIHALLVLVLYIWVAAQASRFFVEARRHGALELILCTPIPIPQIIGGQWAALQRMFVLPAGVFLVMQMAVVALQVQMFSGKSGSTITVPGARNVDFELYQFIAGVVGAVEFVTELCALSWFGMWMGLTTKKSNVAVIKTLGFVVILPWLAMMICQTFTMFFIGLRGNLPFWSSALIMGGLSVAKDIFFIIWSRWKLHTAFRVAAASADTPQHFMGRGRRRSDQTRNTEEIAR